MRTFVWCALIISRMESTVQVAKFGRAEKAMWYVPLSTFSGNVTSAIQGYLDSSGSWEYMTAFQRLPGSPSFIDRSSYRLGVPLNWHFVVHISVLEGPKCISSDEERPFLHALCIAA